jgi:hypothetical protein
MPQRQTSIRNAIAKLLIGRFLSVLKAGKMSSSAGRLVERGAQTLSVPAANAAFIYRLHSGDGLKQGCFAGAVRTNYAEAPLRRIDQ